MRPGDAAEMEHFLRLRIALPALYLSVAILAWVNFWQLPPDGLANVGLMLVVLPVTALDLILRSPEAPGSSVLMPDSFGYYGDHALFFGISVAVIAAFLWWVGAVLDRRRTARKG